MYLPAVLNNIYTTHLQMMDRTPMVVKMIGLPGKYVKMDIGIMVLQWSCKLISHYTGHYISLSSSLLSCYTFIVAIHAERNQDYGTVDRSCTSKLIFTAQRFIRWIPSDLTPVASLLSIIIIIIIIIIIVVIVVVVIVIIIIFETYRIFMKSKIKDLLL